MAVWCRQAVDGESQEPYPIEPHFDGQTDADLLAAKEKGAREKGWTVKRTGRGSFRATKVRWATEAECVRDFWAD